MRYDLDHSRDLSAEHKKYDKPTKEQVRKLNNLCKELKIHKSMLSCKTALEYSETIKMLEFNKEEILNESLKNKDKTEAYLAEER